MVRITSREESSTGCGDCPPSGSGSSDPTGVQAAASSAETTRTVRTTSSSTSTELLDRITGLIGDVPTLWWILLVAIAIWALNRNRSRS